MSYDYDAEKMLEIAIVALHKVANPIGSAVKYLEPGTELEENWRYIVTSPDYISAVASEALGKIANYKQSRAPLSVMIGRFGKDRKYWRPGMSKGDYAYVHEADNQIYFKRGLHAFAAPNADDWLSSDWHLVIEGGTE